MACYLFGLALGPVVLTPISEDYGRRPTFAACLAVLALLQIPTALAPDYATLVVCRFLSGCVAAPIFNSCCNVSDLWQDLNQGVPGFAINVWALSIELIVLAPIWGAYITERLGWRWLWGVSGIVTAFLLLLFLLLVPETRHNVILARRASRQHSDSKSTDQTSTKPETVVHKRTVREILNETVYRPVRMLFSEPIVYLFALYDGLNYSSTFIVIEAVPLIYARHNIHEPEVNFLFFAVVIGYVLAVCAYPLQYRLCTAKDKQAGCRIPEHKLLWGMVGGLLFPVSVYAFAWLCVPSIHWTASAAMLVLFGVASHILLVMVSDYTVEAYGHLASSAITGQSFARETLSAGGIMIGELFYEGVGYSQASTIIAVLATLLGVMPFLFYRYGARVRAHSRFSQQIKEAAAQKEGHANQAAVA